MKLKQKVLLTSGSVAGIATLLATVSVLTINDVSSIRYLAVSGYWYAFGLTLFFVGLAIPKENK